MLCGQKEYSTRRTNCKVVHRAGARVPRDRATKFICLSHLHFESQSNHVTSIRCFSWDTSKPRILSDRLKRQPLRMRILSEAKLEGSVLAKAAVRLKICAAAIKNPGLWTKVYSFWASQTKLPTFLRTPDELTQKRVVSGEPGGRGVIRGNRWFAGLPELADPNPNLHPSEPSLSFFFSLLSMR